MKRIIVISILSICLGVGLSNLGTDTAWAEEVTEAQEVTEVTRKGFLGENIYATMGLQSGYITGHTKSHTSYPLLGYTGESELEYPLGNFFLGVEGVLGLKNSENGKQDRARLAIGWLTNVGADSGTMKDSDLVNGYLWSYTESDSELKAHIVDVSAIYNFWPLKTISIGPMIGYRYQYFDFNIYNYSGTQLGIPISGSGHVLDYTVKYHISYYGLNSDFLFRDTLWFNSRVAFTYAFANDRDDHLLRQTRYEASCDGPGVLANINANWEFLPNWLLQAGGEYTYIDTEGKQDVFDSGGAYVGQTDAEVTYSAWILKYRF